MLRYAITDRHLFPNAEEQQLSALVSQTARWAAAGIDFIQLREKDLSAAILTSLARRILEKIHGTVTRLLINSRADVAIAAGAHGVHLTSEPDALTPTHVRWLYAEASLAPPVISVSCHTTFEAEQAHNLGADFILFAPVFQKTITGQLISTGQGLKVLHAACLAAAPVPVIALGGVTHENANDCVQAGAIGVAGIRLFQNL
ncbi:MAG TPA: thiamine phosphate synthase [Edaphobacter sp.]|nr:thiamine phosphate synthase [Edaphobacter sp.]